MPIYKSGSPVNTGGTSLPQPPQQPGTFTKSLRFMGARLSTAAGSYGDTATAQLLWTADAPSRVVSVLERHNVVGSTTGMLVIAPGSTPLNSGSNVLASTLDMTSAVDVPNNATLLNSATLQTLATGDALGVRATTPGNLPPVGIWEVTLEYI